MALWVPQPGPQVRGAQCPVDFPFFGGSRGGGKGTVSSSRILTPKGWGWFGDIQLGNTITDPTTGGTQKVIGIFPLGKRDIYRICFDDKSETLVTKDHLWIYKCANRPRPLTKKSKQREWIKKNLGAEYPNGRLNHLRIGTTEKLIKELETGKHNPRIPLTKPVLFDVNGRTGKNALDPYLIGLMLGDGTFSNGQRGNILTTEDTEIISYLKDCGFLPSGERFSKKGIELSWYLSNKTKVGTSLVYWASNHGLIGKTGKNKFLPKYIFTASIEYRVAIIQGLLDSDGFADKRGHVEFTNISDHLVYGVRDLIWSLGGKATVSDSIVGQYKKDTGKVVECQTYRRVYIWTAFSSKLFRLKRKSKRCTDSWNGGYENMRKVVSIDYFHKEEAACIKVSSPYGLYVTDDYIVTHNSDCLLGRHIIGADRYARYWNGLIVRRKYKEFHELRRRIDDLIADGLPAERTGGNQQLNHLRFDNGAEVVLAAIMRPELANDWVGHSFTEISIDECTTFPFFSKMVDKLRGSLRSAHGVPCHMFGTGNPGGSGHMQVKDFFKLGSAGLAECINPYTVFTEIEESRVFIPSFLHENLILWENDPKYVKRLLSISDPALRRAWLLGDWDVFIGQAFYWSPKRHIIPYFPVPDYVPIIMTYDWGYGAPFSVGWWWVDADGRVYRFMEWYGWNGSPNEGLRIEDSKVAEGILEREHKAGINNRIVDRLAGPDCFNRKPNYQGGGQGPSTAEVFRGSGIKLRPGDPERKLKIRQFRERLKIPNNSFEMPMMVVYQSCSQFIRTVPPLAMDEDNPEDLDTDQEDHVYDEACHIAMSRPLTIPADQIRVMIETEIQKQKRKELTPAHQKVWAELDKIKERMRELQE